MFKFYFTNAKMGVTMEKIEDRTYVPIINRKEIKVGWQ